MRSLQTQFWAVRDYLAPVLKSSKFDEHGRITPDEFVAAGDYLVFKFPAWRWNAGDANRAKDYLPKDKQYLCIDKVPCSQRASALSMGLDLQNWSEDEIDKIPNAEPESNTQEPNVLALSDSDEATAPNTSAARVYDCLITYDKYYQTPRFWLRGFDENGQQLPSKQVFQDISAEHASKTVTIEPFPHSSATLPSVHPCQHANVMRRFIKQMNGAMQGANAEMDTDAEVDRPQLRVDQYLLVFLKLIATITPTIEIDATADI